MVYKNVVSIGDKVALSKSVGLKEQTGVKQYVSQVLDLLENDTKAIVSMPMENGRVIPLSVGDKYQAFFYTKKGMYQCNCEILDRYKEDNIYVMIIQFISAFEKYQRRQYFRLDMLKDIEFRLVTVQEQAIAQKLNEDNFESDILKAKFENTLAALQAVWSNGVITDLSGGGMRFNAQIDRNETKELVVKLDFQLGNKEYSYELTSEIVAVSSMSNKPGFDEYRICFKNITKEERENLIKYIFEEERKRRNKGNN